MYFIKNRHISYERLHLLHVSSLSPSLGYNINDPDERHNSKHSIEQHGTLHTTKLLYPPDHTGTGEGDDQRTGGQRPGRTLQTAHHLQGQSASR